jgi:hypothetical protein
MVEGEPEYPPDLSTIMLTGLGNKVLGGIFLQPTQVVFFGELGPFLD